MTPKVSILIITYRQAGTIGRAIDSVLAQDVPFPIEIIIADDASPDGTRNICREYASAYPQIIRLLPDEPNMGVAANYFRAIDAAEGEYVTDCAGDDTMGAPDRLRRQVEFLDSHPDCSAVISDWTIMRGGEATSSASLPNYTAFRRQVKGTEFLRLVLGSQNSLPFLSAVLFRRRPIAEIRGTDPDRPLRPGWNCEDIPVLAAIASAGDVGYLPLDASTYFVNTGSVSQPEQQLRSARFYLGTSECVADLCNLWSLPYSEIATALDTRLRFIASILIDSKTAADAETVRRLQELGDRLRCITSIRTRLYIRAVSHPCLRDAIRLIKRSALHLQK